ncbi:class I SAM-dependent methyltransferase [Sneathiella chinensis]|uniref:ATP synthase subunit beta n=1 Tax=Sneathiella chinensis TaxID=349750 RepID=A0ABQ5U3I4_9PROT|nr:SAM-dependent methyltransferase [Sneathiella chinensis]GLQ06230.1 ATP synthase subunit beta [Sneathiella chinensis]
MSALADILKARIQSDGPLSLYTFMQESLSHPAHGYYQSATPFGQQGDFITAPEISQMFGELIGLWCVDCWAKLGAPSRFHLVELGPGNGTLMADALRSARIVPDFLKAASVHMVETSARLTRIQKDRVKHPTLNWHTELPDLGDAPVLYIANEFFDALPIRQYEILGGEWHERLVTTDGDGFAYCLGAAIPSPDEHGLPDPATLTDGTVFEINPEAAQIVTRMGQTITANRGAALVLDYGPLQDRFGDSFQALKDHRFTDPLAAPGTADLTAHVHFQDLAQAAQKAGCIAAPITTQGRFLERLGIEARVLTLLRNATTEQADKLRSDHRRLVSAEEMGTLFKALTFHAGMTAPPAGFEE